MISTFMLGFGTSISLILAIGAQNAFVLRQGLLREHVLAVALFCGLSDAIFITFGVFGAGAIATQYPDSVFLFALLGTGFLGWYGINRLVSAYRGTTALEIETGGTRSLKTILLTAAGFTFLNPHVYLDTLVLIGSIAAPLPEDSKITFAIGAVSASFVFFFSLAYGARLLAPLFTHPRAWRFLDAAVGVLILLIAAILMQYAFGISPHQAGG